MMYSLLFLFAACGNDSQVARAPAEGTPVAAIRIDGSSTVYPITEAVAEEYRKAGHDVQVTVGVSGTGGGFEKFCAGETVITDASRPIKQGEIERCAQNGITYVELPIAYDGLAVVVHPTNTWAHSITTDELRRMWEPAAQGRVMKWSQVRPDWPDGELHLYGAGVDSGSYDYFTEAINHAEHASRGDFTSSEDDNVLVQGVSTDPGALGFFGLAYYTENKDKLKLLPVDDGNPANGAGPVAPSVESIQAATYQPLSRPLFVYVAAPALDHAEVASFIRYYLEKAPVLAGEVGYVALPADAYPRLQARVDERKIGSVFAKHGSQVGITLDTLLGEPSMPALPATRGGAGAVPR